MRALLGLGVTLLLLSPPLRGEVTARPERQGGSRIVGVVLDVVGRRPIDGARIHLRDTPGEVVSDENGHFAFTDVPPGDYVLETSRVGYADRVDSVSVERGQELSVEVALASSPLDLPPLLVVIRSQRLVSAGFYERRAHGGGTFITRDDIEARHEERLSDVLARLPGLHRSVRNNGSTTIGMRGVKTITTDCRTEYFVDGVPALLEEIGVDAVSIHDIEGVEVYRGSSELPIEFHAGRAMCGAILIWTRDGSAP